jgi:integrase
MTIETKRASPARRQSAWVDRIRPAAKRRELPDRSTGKVSGLYLIVQPSGAKSFAVRYRLHGKAFKYTIGNDARFTLAEARAEAHDILQMVAKDIDPIAAKRERAGAQQASFEAVVREFIARYCKKNRTWPETARLLGLKVSDGGLVVIDGGLVQRFQHRKIDTIRRDEIIAVLDDIVDRGAPYAANRSLATVRKLFNWALPRYRLAENPCRGISPPGEECSRDRTLTDAELVAVWHATDKLGYPFGPIVKLLILTGQRRGEVGAMEWSELDFERRLWTLPPERTKNERRHEVPLSATAVAILESLPRRGQFVFSMPYRRSAPVGFDAAKARLDELSGVTGWRLHDIRRTVASGMAGPPMKVSLPVIEKVLNHVSGTFRGIVGVYQRHEYSTEKREALDAWAAHVERLVNPPADNVVDLRTAQVTSGAA